MHIVLISHEYSHPQLPEAGGIGRFVADYSQQLVEKGHIVSVFGYSEVYLETNYKGVDLFFKKSTMTPLHIFLERVFHKLNWTKSLIPFHAKDRFRLAQRVDKFCEENNVDIIEVNDYLGDGAFLKTKTPKVMRSHGSYKLLIEDLNFRQNDSFVYFEDEQAKIVDAYISVSKFSANKLKSLFNINENIDVVYSGVETEGVYRKPFPEQSRIFYFGTLSKAKGSDRLIDIYNRLSIQFPEMQFAIAGKTKEYFETELYPYFNETLKSKIEFLGFLDKEEVLSEIDKSTYIIFPSRLENFSIALLEAMSKGRICLGWKIPAFEEIIENEKNGFLVDQDTDIDNLFLNLEEDKLKRFELSENAFNLIQNLFSKDNMVENSLKIYQRVINSKLN